MCWTPSRPELSVLLKRFVVWNKGLKNSFNIRKRVKLLYYSSKESKITVLRRAGGLSSQFLSYYIFVVILIHGFTHLWEFITWQIHDDPPPCRFIRYHTPLTWFNILNTTWESPRPRQRHKSNESCRIWRRFTLFPPCLRPLTSSQRPAKHPPALTKQSPSAVFHQSNLFWTFSVTHVSFELSRTLLKTPLEFFRLSLTWNEETECRHHDNLWANSKVQDDAVHCGICSLKSVVEWRMQTF